MFNAQQKKRALRITRHRRVRARVHGTGERPRISVFRSGKHVYAQLIDDAKQITLTAVWDGEIPEKGEVKKGRATIASAKAVGTMLAERAKTKGVKRAVFDRGGYAYHGIVAAVAEGAREGGLEF